MYPKIKKPILKHNNDNYNEITGEFKKSHSNQNQ